MRGRSGEEIPVLHRCEARQGRRDACPRPVPRQAAPERKPESDTGPGVQPGGAKGGPGVSGRWSAATLRPREGRTDAPPDRPRPWPSKPLAHAAWAGTSARSRYRRGPRVRAGRGGLPPPGLRAGWRDPGAGNPGPSRGRASLPGFLGLPATPAP